MAKLNERGHEILDPNPVEIPVGFHQPPTLEARMRALIRTEMSQLAAQKGEETFEEADDFDIGDDFDPTSPYEQHFDHDDNIDSLKTQIKESKAKRQKKGSRFQEETPKNRASETSDAQQSQ